MRKNSKVRCWLRALAGEDDDRLSLGDSGDSLKDAVVIEAVVKSSEGPNAL
jgi:hypothetical protein